MTEKEEGGNDLPGMPSDDEIRAARHAGFADSIAHMNAERQERLTSEYLESDRRRERNISGFSNTIGE